jgi:hypothetical protein
VTRERKLKEVLNVRLDERLSRELRRIALTRGQSESEVARWLLRYGIEVSRRLEAQNLAEPYSWEIEPNDDPFAERPGVVEVEAKWRPMTDDELIARGFHEWLPDDDAPEWEPDDAP